MKMTILTPQLEPKILPDFPHTCCRGSHHSGRTQRAARLGHREGKFAKLKHKPKKNFQEAHMPVTLSKNEKRFWMI